MGRLFQVFAYVFAIAIGAYLLVFTSDGHIIKICIACNFFLQNLFAVVSILTGAVGLVGTAASKKAIATR